jgi:hypothetical protein
MCGWVEEWNVAATQSTVSQQVQHVQQLAGANWHTRDPVGVSLLTKLLMLTDATWPS